MLSPATIRVRFLGGLAAALLLAGAIRATTTPAPLRVLPSGAWPSLGFALPLDTGRALPPLCSMRVAAGDTAHTTPMPTVPGESQVVPMPVRTTGACTPQAREQR